MRAVLGRRVDRLLERFASQVTFLAPEVAFAVVGDRHPLDGLDREAAHPEPERLSADQDQLGPHVREEQVDRRFVQRSFIGWQSRLCRHARQYGESISLRPRALPPENQLSLAFCPAFGVNPAAGLPLMRPARPATTRAGW